MNILVIKLSSLNGIASSMMRTVGLIKGLEELGHKVDFMTLSDRSSVLPTWSEQMSFDDDVRLITIGGSSLYNTVIKKEKKGKCLPVNVLRRIYHAFSLYDNTIMVARKIQIGSTQAFYDVVISVSDPKSSHVAAKRLFKQGVRTKYWIQYWGDPMTLDITSKSKMPHFVYRREERRLLAECDKIVYTNPLTAEAQKRMFPNFADKIMHVPTALSREIKCVRQAGKPFRVSYIGAYNSNVRNILPLYQASLRFGKDVETYIVGDSDQQLAGMDSVHILPRGDASDIEEKTDLFICVLNLSGIQIPGKVYHYAASNRPILVILDGNDKEKIQNYLARFDRYMFCDNDVEQIVQAINTARHSDRLWNGCEAMLPKNVAEQILKL